MTVAVPAYFHRFALLIFSALFCSVASASAQNLITNGGFETAPTAGSGNNNPASPAYYSNNTGPTQITPAGTGWTFGLDAPAASTDTARVEWFSAAKAESWDHAPSATGGTYALELNSDSTTEHLYAQQAVSLTAGKSYTLKLDIAPETAFPNTPFPSVVVTLRNGTALTSTALSTFTFTVTGSGWQTVSVTFVAPTGASVIRFEDSAPGSNSQSNITLDNISLVPATPEPGTLWSTLVIVLGICDLERKRIRHAFRRIRLT
jgi:hypothetical protein